MRRAIEKTKALALEEQPDWVNNGGHEGDSMKPFTDLWDTFSGTSKGRQYSSRQDSSTGYGDDNFNDHHEDSRATNSETHHSPQSRSQGPNSTTGSKASNPQTSNIATNTSPQWTAVTPVSRPVDGRPPLVPFKKLISQATESNDPFLIEDLALAAEREKPFRDLIVRVAEGRATSPELDDFSRRVQNAKNLLAWEATWAAKAEAHEEEEEEVQEDGGGVSLI